MFKSDFFSFFLSFDALKQKRFLQHCYSTFVWSNVLLFAYFFSRRFFFFFVFFLGLCLPYRERFLNKKINSVWHHFKLHLRILFCFLDIQKIISKQSRELKHNTRKFTSTEINGLIDISALSLRQFLTSFAKKRTLTQTLYRGILDKFKFWKWFSLFSSATDLLPLPKKKNLLKQSHIWEREKYMPLNLFYFSYWYINIVLWKRKYQCINVYFVYSLLSLL